MRAGRFIVIDGGEGAGKGTVLEELRKEFPSPGTIYTREPGGTKLAEEIRSKVLSQEGGQMSPLTQFDLFWAARSDHLQNLITPALLAGRNVISDRFDCSTFAYQVRGQEHLSLESLFWEMRRQHLAYTPPPFYIYLDVDPEEGQRRIQGRVEGNHFDHQELAFHARVRHGFLSFLSKGSTLQSPLEQARYDPRIEGTVINANRSLSEVVAETIQIIKSHLT